MIEEFAWILYKYTYLRSQCVWLQSANNAPSVMHIAQLSIVSSLLLFYSTFSMSFLTLSHNFKLVKCANLKTPTNNVSERVSVSRALFCSRRGLDLYSRLFRAFYTILLVYFLVYYKSVANYYLYLCILTYQLLIYFYAYAFQIYKNFIYFTCFSIF